MSDMPKGLKVASTVRWSLAAAASLLTVTSGYLVWVEVTDRTSSGPRAFIWAISLLLWIAFVALSCAILVVRCVVKRIDRWGNKLLRAYATQRGGAGFELMDETNVTSIYGRR